MREEKKKRETTTPARLRRDSGVTPVQESEVNSKRSESDAESEAEQEVKSETEVTGADYLTDPTARPPNLTSCAKQARDPWSYTGIDRSRIPQKFLRADSFEGRFQQLLIEYGQWSHEDGDCCCAPADFLEHTMGALEDSKVRYPKAVLARKKALQSSEMVGA